MNDEEHKKVTDYEWKIVSVFFTTLDRLRVSRYLWSSTHITDYIWEMKYGGGY